MKEEIIAITERGTLTLPAAFRKQLGISGRQQLIATISEAGEIVLKPALVLPIELYSEERIKEFAAQDDALGQFLAADKK